MQKITLFLCCCLLAFYCIGCQENASISNSRFDDTDESPQVGGLGFTGEGWESNEKAMPFALQESYKGGSLNIALRVDYDNNEEPQEIQNLIYESLLMLHPNTLEFIPSLATHWQILRDYKTFRFRLNPKARWADGTQVTTKDIIATWEEMIQNESVYKHQICLNFYKPVAESKYIFHITAKELHWRFFEEFALMNIYPEKELKRIHQENKKLKNIQFGSGPYNLVKDDDVSIVLNRRKDYWAQDTKFRKGAYNFDTIQIFSLINETDDDKLFDDFKKGKYDIHHVEIAKQWAEDTNFDEVERGLIQKKKIFNQSVHPFSGIAFNLRKEPFNDINVRRAFVYLFNREKMVKEMFYNEYKPLDSFFPGSVYENKKNPQYRYSLEKAKKALDKAGWKLKNGVRVKNGKPLQATMLIHSVMMPTIEKIYLQDLKAAGIILKLQALDENNEEKIMNHNFELLWYDKDATIFLDLERFWSSQSADQDRSYNFTGTKIDQVDKICRAYSRMFSQSQRIKALQALDNALMKHIPYALGWWLEPARLLYWNKFNYPKGHFSRTGTLADIFILWSIKPDVLPILEQAKTNKNITLPKEPIEVRYHY